MPLKPALGRQISVNSGPTWSTQRDPVSKINNKKSNKGADRHVVGTLSGATLN